MHTYSDGMPSMGFVPVQIYLPVLILLSYAAFLITGFATQLGVLQPLPLYIAFSVILLVLQTVITGSRSLVRIIYIYVTSGFAIVYAAERVFNSAQNFTRSPYTYVIINALLLIVFVADAINRRRGPAGGVSMRGHSGGISRAARVAEHTYGVLATDFAGLAVLFYVAAFLLDMLGPQNLLHRLGLHVGSAYVSAIDLNTTLGLHLAPPLNQLQMVDLVIALAATAASLLLLVIVGALVVPTMPASGQASGQADEAARNFGSSLAEIVRVALEQVSLSLRLVLGPLVWLIPAFLIAAFSQHVTTYLNFAGRFPGANLLDLFNPLGRAGLDNASDGFVTLGFGLIAIAAVIVSVVVIDHDAGVVARTVRIFANAGRVIALTWAFFLYSLATLNAVAVLISLTQREPFQVGAPGLLALLAFAGFVMFASLRPPIATPAPVAPAPAEMTGATVR